jgi:hypothetical protein
VRKTFIILAFVAVAGAALGRLTSLGVYMVDASQREFAMRNVRPPDDDSPSFHQFSTLRHNCFTCYVISTHLAEQGCENIWEPAGYRDSEDPTPFHDQIGDVVTIDRYQYPPQFMLIPKVLFLLSRDFFTLRTIWFVVNIVVIAVSMILVARWCAGKFDAMRVALCLLPFLSPAVLTSLQFGNVHLLIIALSMLGMLAIETGRMRTGAFLVALVTVSKIFPGILIVFLLLRRRFRVCAWIGAFAVMLTFVTLLAFGWQPFEKFFTYQLPRLASGDAFGFARTMLRPMALNMSFYGVVFKLSSLGMITVENPAALASIVTWIFTAVLLAVVVFAGLRRPCVPGTYRGRLREAALWLVILILAQQRSGFLPWTYGTFAALWLICLLVPTSPKWYKRVVPLVVLGVCLGVSVPTPFGPNTFDFAVTFTFLIWLLLFAFCLGVVGMRFGVLRDDPDDLADPAGRSALSDDSFA